MWGARAGSRIHRAMQRTLRLVAAADAPTVLPAVASAQAGGGTPGLFLSPAPALPLGCGGPSAGRCAGAKSTPAPLLERRLQELPLTRDGPSFPCPPLPHPSRLLPGVPSCAQALRLRAKGSEAWAVRILRVPRVLHRRDARRWAAWALLCRVRLPLPGLSFSTVENPGILNMKEEAWKVSGDRKEGSGSRRTLPTPGPPSPGPERFRTHGPASSCWRMCHLRLWLWKVFICGVTGQKCQRTNLPVPRRASFGG